MTPFQGTSLLNNKDNLTSSLLNAQSSPLAAFVVAESALAVRLIHTVHQSLSAMNKSLKSGMTLSVTLLESAVDIASMKVSTTVILILTFKLLQHFLFYF